MMTMTPGLRKLALTAHITFSVGWLGAVVAYLAVAIAGLVSQDAQVQQSGYATMELIGWFVIVPLSLAALLSGLVQSLGTEWGLFRFYWVAVKLVMTLGAVTVLLMHMPAVAAGPASCPRWSTPAVAFWCCSRPQRCRCSSRGAESEAKRLPARDGGCTCCLEPSV